MKIWYPCTIQKELEGKVLVTFPDFPETLTEGETEEEALFNAAEALTLTLEGRAEENMDIPFPSQIESGLMVHHGRVHPKWKTYTIGHLCVS